MNHSLSYIGKTVDRYEFQASIGKGTFGEVYKAFDRRLLRQVAIKVSSPKFESNRLDKDHILREAQIIARVEHANIVPIYDVVDNDESVLIVMRLVKGEDLGQMMNHRKNPFDANEAYKIMYQVMWGMDFAHSRGVVHSDLKPGNILLSDNYEAVIMDFGLSALLELQKPEKGKLYGTPSYMPPEQIKGIFLDARSDIYSLGIIIYKMITGHHPFNYVDSLDQLLKFQLERIPEDPIKYNPVIPEKFSRSVLRALEKNPGNRYYSCKEFMNALEDSLPDVSVQREIKHKDLRWEPRVTVNLKGRLHLNQAGEPIAAKITNLSVNGASIVVPVNITTGSKLRVEFEIPEDGSYVRMTSPGTVLRKDRITDTDLIEIGVSFDGLEDIDKQYIRLYIRNLLLG